MSGHPDLVPPYSSQGRARFTLIHPGTRVDCLFFCSTGCRLSRKRIGTWSLATWLGLVMFQRESGAAHTAAAIVLGMAGWPAGLLGRHLEDHLGRMPIRSSRQLAQVISSPLCQLFSANALFSRHIPALALEAPDRHCVSADVAGRRSPPLGFWWDLRDRACGRASSGLDGSDEGPMATSTLWCFCAAQGELRRPKRCARGMSRWDAMRPSSMTLARCHRPAPSMLDALAQKGSTTKCDSKARVVESAPIAAQPSSPDGRFISISLSRLCRRCLRVCVSCSGR